MHSIYFVAISKQLLTATKERKVVSEPQLISETFTEEGRFVRVDSTWSDGFKGVRYQYRDPLTLDDGASRNSDRWVAFVSCVIIAFAALAAIIESAKAIWKAIWKVFS